MSEYNKNERLYIGEVQGDYLPDYYCMNCNEDLEFEHQERCKHCGQLQAWSLEDVGEYCNE